MEAITPLDEDDVAVTEEIWQEPFAMACCYYSSVTVPVTSLSSGYQIPVSSGSATSADLDDPSGRRLFSRTIPTNAGDARAAMAYYNFIGVAHVANIFVKDSWGAAYNLDLQKQAKIHNISLLSFSYDVKQPGSIESAVMDLKQSGYRYIFSIFHSWEETLPIMHKHGIVGRNKGYDLIAAEEFDWVWGSFRVEEGYATDALDGVGVLQLHNDDHPLFRKAMTEFSQSSTLQKEFVDSIRDPVLKQAFVNYTFPAADLSAQKYMSYDAQITLGLAACATPGLFTGQEMYENLLKVDFEGVTGHVQLDPRTGTRLPESVKFRLDNVVLASFSSNRTQGSQRAFDSSLAAIMAGDTVTTYDPYVFSDGTTTPVQPLPDLAFDYNLMPLWVQIFGWISASLVMLLSIGLLGWTIKNRTLFVVRASQPIFLVQLCIGCIIMASSVFPMSMQGKEPSDSFDRACMTVPWLFVVGFVTSISALSCKTWRLNKLMSSAQTMRRIKVEPKDAIKSFVISMTLNVALLIAWTVVVPYEYVRVDVDNLDMFGRSTESYGHCKASSNTVYWFIIPVMAINLCMLGVATYQSFVARNYATELSESYYLLLALMSMVESLCLGVPILFVVADSPTADFFVRSSLICIICLSILVPVFLPKFLKSQDPNANHQRTVVRASSNMPLFNTNNTRSSRERLGLSGSNSTRFSNFSRESESNDVRDLERSEYGKMTIIRKT